MGNAAVIVELPKMVSDNSNLLDNSIQYFLYEEFQASANKNEHRI